MVTSSPFLIARVTEENDFLTLKEMASCHDNWSLAYDRNDIKIWSRAVSDSTIKMIKVWAIFSGISSTDLYNTLMDPVYRKVWDTHLVLFYDIGYLNSNNEVTYYAVSFPPPLRSRDFVLQTSWLDRNTEHFILNHSVCHKDHPPRPGFIRAISLFTGYFIKGIPHDGCEMFFVSQTDLQGFIPNWVAAKCTEIFAPRIVKQIEKAAAGYSAWKSQNSPGYFPWSNPEQIKASAISVADCVPSDEEKQSSFFRSVTEKNAKLSSGPPLQNKSVASKSEVASSNSVAGTSKLQGKVVESPDRRKRVPSTQSSINTTGKRKSLKSVRQLNGRFLRI